MAFHWFTGDTAGLDMRWGRGFWTSIGTACAFIATLISMVHLFQHWIARGGGRARQCTLRILAVVPLFSVDAALCLNYPHKLPILLTGVRDFYESVVLVSFVQLLLAYLGRADQGKWRSNRTPATKLADMLSMQTPQHPGILRCIPVPYLPGLDFVAWVLAGTLQYAVMMNLVLLLDIVVWIGRLYTTGHDELLARTLGAADGMKAASAGFALYNLGLLYLEACRCENTEKQLHSIHPENKFLCVKLIVFFTFWQKMFCTFLQNRGYLPTAPGWAPDEVANGIQSFLLCIEMVIFAFWHRFAYPVGEFNKVASRAALAEAVQKKSVRALTAALNEAKEAGLVDQVFEIRGHSHVMQDGLRLALADQNGRRLRIVDESLAEVSGTMHLEEAVVVEARELRDKLDAEEGGGTPMQWGRAGSSPHTRTWGSLRSPNAISDRLGSMSPKREKTALEPLRVWDMVRDVKDIWDLSRRYREAASLLRHPKVWAVYRMLEGGVAESGIVHEEKIRQAFETAGGSSADGARARAEDVSRSFADLSYRPTPKMADMLERQKDEEDGTVSCEDLLAMFKREEDEALGRAFDELDVKKDGVVREWELKATLKKVGVTPTKQMLADFFQGNSSLTRKQFMDWYRSHDSKRSGSERTTIKHEQSTTNHSRLKEAFDTFDLDQNGYITRAEFRFMLIATREAHADQDIDALFDQLDDDQNDQIDFAEFERACHVIMPAQGRHRSWTNSAVEKVSAGGSAILSGVTRAIGRRSGIAGGSSAASTPLLQAEANGTSPPPTLTLPGNCTPERGQRLARPPAFGGEDVDVEGQQRAEFRGVSVLDLTGIDSPEPTPHSSQQRSSPPSSQQSSPAKFLADPAAQAARAAQLLRALQLRQQSAEDRLQHVSDLHRARRNVEEGEARARNAVLPRHADPLSVSSPSRFGAAALGGTRPFASRPW